MNDRRLIDRQIYVIEVQIHQNRIGVLMNHFYFLRKLIKDFSDKALMHFTIIIQTIYNAS